MGFIKDVIDNVIDTVVDVVDEVVDTVVDVVEEVVSWVIPEMPELPEFNATPIDSQDLGTQGILLTKEKVIVLYHCYMEQDELVGILYG